MNLCICDDDAIVHDKIKELLCSFEINEDNISVTDVFSGEELQEPAGFPARRALRPKERSLVYNPEQAPPKSEIPCP